MDKTHEMIQKVPGRQYCESSLSGMLDDDSGSTSAVGRASRENSMVCSVSKESMMGLCDGMTKRGSARFVKGFRDGNNWEQGRGIQHLYSCSLHRS